MQRTTLEALFVAGALSLTTSRATAQLCGGPVAQIVSPTPGAKLPIGAVTFSWCQANGDYFLDVESVLGAHDIFFAFPVGESVTLGPGCAAVPPIGCIPPRGETIYATLWTNIAVSGRKNYVAAPTVMFTASRGDIDGNGGVDVGDVFFLVNYLFAAGPAPAGPPDLNGDGTIDVGDVFFLVNYLFAGGPAPN